MNDDFKRKLNEALGEPPPAPPGELAAILARLRRARPERPWLRLVPAGGFALSLLLVAATVSFVHPRTPARTTATGSPYELRTPYDESLEPFRALVSQR